MKNLLHRAQRFGLCPFEMGVFKKKLGTGMSFTMKVRLWLSFEAFIGLEKMRG